MHKQTIVDEVADALAFRVASGVYSPGDMLPSVRQVAEEFDVNRATAQLILGRLESAGFVDARRGLGFAVRDVRLYGGLDTYRSLFRFSRRLPDTASRLFRELTELQQLVLSQTMRTIAAEPRRYDPGPARRAAERLELLASSDRPDLAEVFHAEFDILRSVLASVGQSMLLALVNSVGEILLEVPEAVRAFYTVQPEEHARVWKALLAHWEEGRPAGADELAICEERAATYHRQAADRFRTLVTPSRRNS